MALGTTWSVSFREAVCDTMTTAAVGAQTEHPGVAVAGEGVAWRLHLTGRFVYFFPSTSFAASARNSRSLWSGLRTGPPPLVVVRSPDRTTSPTEGLLFGKAGRPSVGGCGRVRRPGHNSTASRRRWPGQETRPQQGALTTGAPFISSRPGASRLPHGTRGWPP